MEQGKQELLNAIAADAAERVAKINADCEAAEQKSTQKAEREQQVFLDDCAARDARDAADIIARRRVAAGMEGKKALLAEKRALLDEVKRRLVERLYALGHEDYLRLVGILLERYAAAGDRVFIAKNAAVTYGDVQSLPICRKLTLKVAYDDVVKSGVLLRGDKLDKDLSFEALADGVFADREMDLAEALFGTKQ